MISMERLRNLHNRRSIALAVTLITALAATALGVAACGNLDTKSGQAPPRPTFTPAALTGAPTIDEGRRALNSRDPILADFVAAVEAEDTDQVLAFFNWSVRDCDELIYRGISECERRGVGAGTVLELFAPEWWEGAGLERAEARDEITYDIMGRHPRLALVAERSDGPVVLLFLIDPMPALVFPGGAPAGGSPTIAIWFATSKDATNRIETFDYRMQGSPPLEFLRYEQHIGRFDFKVLGVTPEFAAIEAEFHAQNESERQASPTP